MYLFIEKTSPLFSRAHQTEQEGVRSLVSLRKHKRRPVLSGRGAETRCNDLSSSIQNDSTSFCLSQSNWFRF